ncbi:MAG: hypothetical protein HDR45_01605 [Bacteroides sp.]|nr:hypothetical protein [Bacteroides sp.]
MRKQITLAILALTAICMPLIAKGQSINFSEDEKELLRQRVRQKVEEFGNALSRMVDTEQTHEVRMAHQKNLLNLFIGKGDPYDIEEGDGETKHSTGVKMMTSSVNSGHVSSSLLRSYIKKLYDPELRRSRLSYSKIRIETADAVRVDNIHKEGDHYVCIAYFYQNFYGIKDGRVIYKDRTCKRIKCYITPIKISDNDIVFDAKLADISVVSTERL